MGAGLPFQACGAERRVALQESQNIKIPLPLFDRIVFFFDCLSVGGHTFPANFGFDAMHAELRAKQNKMNIRTAYTNTLLAKDDSHRLHAYANYQKLKNGL